MLDLTIFDNRKGSAFWRALRAAKRASDRTDAASVDESFEDWEELVEQEESAASESPEPSQRE